MKEIMGSLGSNENKITTLTASKIEIETLKKIGFSDFTNEPSRNFGFNAMVLFSLSLKIITCQLTKSFGLTLTCK